MNATFFCFFWYHGRERDHELLIREGRAQLTNQNFQKTNNCTSLEEGLSEGSLPSVDC
jgi:hypothetical protein